MQFVLKYYRRSSQLRKAVIPEFVPPALLSAFEINTGKILACEDTLSLELLLEGDRSEGYR